MLKNKLYNRRALLARLAFVSLIAGISISLRVGFAGFASIPNTLTCGYAVDPIGIDDVQPLLGWQLPPAPNAMQTAYRVIVAANPDKLRKNAGDVWDSGKVPSSQSQNVRYGGKPLRSGQYYYWKVQVWDRDGRASEWSQPAFWSMGILSEQEWGGKWISSRYADVSSEKWYKVSRENREKYPNYVATDTAAVYLRKNFDVANKIERATTFICGLGYYELYINGEKIGDRVMDPVFTDYQKQVCYATYNVTTFLKNGKNSIGVILGNGFYNQPTKDLFGMETAPWKTPPKLMANIIIEYKSGKKQVIVTDETWKWSTGEIVFNCIRGGETIDKREHQKGWHLASFNDLGWQSATAVPAPVGTLKAQRMPPMKVNEHIQPVKITEPKKGIYLVDFGKNITGWVAFTTRGKKGQTIICNYSEGLNNDGSINPRKSAGHTDGRYQTGILILNGDGDETFEPRFTYHGFRYVQLQGLTQPIQAGDIAAKSIHTALDTIGYFSCSDVRFNNMQAAVQRTLLNSVHSMPGEEPTREKMGWTFDAGVLTESYLYNFDAITTYKKSMQDFMDSREPSGHIPSIVPTNGWNFYPPEGGIPTQCCYSPWWGGAIYMIVDRLFEHTGDTAIVAHAFDTMKGYVDFVATTADDDFVYWQIGDWLELNHGKPNKLTPVVQTSTAGYYWMNDRLSAFARILGKDAIAEQYAAHARRICDKFNTAFLDRETGWYAQNSQTAQALPLILGMVPDDMKHKVEKCLLAAIEWNKGHISAGFIGANPVLEYLSRNGYEEAVFGMVSKPESPGWLHHAPDAFSTMGENLNAQGYGTGHHPYGAHIGFWLFKYLGGIRPDTNKPGFQDFIIEPMFVPEMDYMTVKTKSLYGEIVSSWKREGNQIILKVVVPGNTRAMLLLPKTALQVEINGKNTGTGKTGKIGEIFKGKKEKFQAPLESGIYKYRFLWEK